MVAVGEYDYTILELAQNKSLSGINGLVWMDDRIHINPPRTLLTSEQLNDFPFVSNVFRRHLNIRKFYQDGVRFPFIDILMGRGCSWGLCIFCSFPNTLNKGANYRVRKISNVIEELKFIKSEMPYIKDVFFEDDNMPKKQAIELSEAILSNHIKMSWVTHARADLSYETLKLMKRSGCRGLNVGYESGNQQILKNIRKGVIVETMERFTKDASSLGIHIIGDLITGLPGETVETIKQTVEWAKRLPIQRYVVSLPKPYEGTPFYDYMVKNGYLKDGHPNYPELSSDDILYWNSWTFRQLYFSPRYFFRMMKHPNDWGSLIRGSIHAVPYLLGKDKKITKDLLW